MAMFVFAVAVVAVAIAGFKRDGGACYSIEIFITGW